jgi:RNA polymerase subunit RPABC4/transcription elongation factor Spt4
MTDALLERFHRVLVEEIRARRPDDLAGPFTVAEIYQNFVPYGSHRDRIGVEINGDYEDALIRLLAGEGDYLVLDSEPALRDLRAELKRSSPDTGIYREFAAVDVRLNQERVARSDRDDATGAVDPVQQAGGQEATAQRLDPPVPTAFPDLAASNATGGPRTAPSSVPPSPGPIRVLPPGVDIFSPPERPTDEPSAGEPRGSTARPPLAPEYVEAVGDDPKPGRSADSCRSCGSRLPERERLRFCPFCGTDVRPTACFSCGEVVEPGWSFCIACGADASA